MAKIQDILNTWATEKDYTHPAWSQFSKLVASDWRDKLESVIHDAQDELVVGRTFNLCWLYYKAAWNDHTLVSLEIFNETFVKLRDTLPSRSKSDDEPVLD